ncbi:MAG TPA: hypothetical protein ENI94_12830 [Gammaproteobacteria bacterium]|nr:hypothetical protein [Gammaproteobacteria bacterium]
MAADKYTIRLEKVLMLLKGARDAHWEGNGYVWDKNTDLLISALNKIFAGEYEWPARAASTAYAYGDSIEDGDFRYTCVQAGTTGAGSVTFPTAIGGTVTDGTVVWECMERLPLVLWDETLAENIAANGQSKTGYESDSVIYTMTCDWSEGLYVPVGHYVKITSSNFTDANNYDYRYVTALCTTAGTLGTEPDYSSATTITKGDAVPNSGGTAVLEVYEASCTSSGYGTCPTLVGFNDCVNDIKDYEDVHIFMKETAFRNL